MKANTLRFTNMSMETLAEEENMEISKLEGLGNEDIVLEIPEDATDVAVVCYTDVDQDYKEDEDLYDATVTTFFDVIYSNGDVDTVESSTYDLEGVDEDELEDVLESDDVTVEISTFFSILSQLRAAGFKAGGKCVRDFLNDFSSVLYLRRK